MSGFDTSQPITDEKSLKNVDTDDEAGKPESSTKAAGDVDADELGDATPGPR
jgi:hypothetical protein